MLNKIVQQKLIVLSMFILAVKCQFGELTISLSEYTIQEQSDYTFSILLVLSETAP